MEDAKQKLLVRFGQRLDNLDKAVNQFKSALQADTSDPVVRSGLIQTFEFTFELCWKLMSDRLLYDGIEVKTPRDAIKDSFKAGYIKDASIWLDALEKRNLMAHSYDESLSKQSEQLIKDKYSFAIIEFYEFAKSLPK